MKLYTLSFLILSISFFSFSGCSPTYPKQNIAESVEKIVKKEYNLDGDAKLVGETLHLNIKLSGLTTTEPKVLNSILNKVQGAVFAVTRVSLSSDAKIKFLVVRAKDPSWKLTIRIIQRLEDVKGYLYQKISRSDYEDRYILEINGEENEIINKQNAAEYENIGDMNIKEFLGRLIVSQINMLGRSNPFLGILLGNSKLELYGFTDDELIIKVGDAISPKILPLFEEIFNSQAEKLVRKFSEWQPEKIKVIGQNNQTLFISKPQ